MSGIRYTSLMKNYHILLCAAILSRSGPDPPAKALEKAPEGGRCTAGAAAGIAKGALDDKEGNVLKSGMIGAGVRARGRRWHWAPRREEQLKSGGAFPQEGATHLRLVFMGSRWISTGFLRAVLALSPQAKPPLQISTRRRQSPQLCRHSSKCPN